MTLKNDVVAAEYNKKYYLEHMNEFKKYAKEYYAAHKDRRLSDYKTWYNENIEKRKLYNQKYAKENADTIQERNRIRRANKLSIAGGHFTSTEFVKLCNSTGNKCLCCGKTDVKLTADHIIPLYDNSPYTDEISNIQPLCRSCNSSKSTKTIDYRNPYIAVNLEIG